MDYLSKRKLYYKYFRGVGLDVGPFDKPFVDGDYAQNQALTVEYVDLHTPEELQKIFDEIPDFSPVQADYIHDVSKHGFGFTNKKYNFIILSHVLEHVVNPFNLLYEAVNKLKNDGILYIGLPDERFSDDKGRRLTTYEELWELYQQKTNTIEDQRIIDYLHAPVISKVDWVRKVLKNGGNFTPEQLENQRLRSFHVHVWNSGGALNHMIRFINSTGLNFKLIETDIWENNGYETVMVFQKQRPSITKSVHIARTKLQGTVRGINKSPASA